MTDETRKTARELAEHICFHRFGISIEEVEERIYQAVQAERERAALIAEEMGKYVSGGYNAAAYDIANAIRGQGK